MKRTDAAGANAASPVHPISAASRAARQSRAAKKDGRLTLRSLTTSARCVNGAATAVGTPMSPFVVEPIKSVDEQRQDEEDRHERHWIDFLMVSFNGVLALFTVALATETWRLRKLANKQAADMQVSIDLARKSSDAALALERPIFILENSDNPALRPQVALIFGNHGRTPAVIVEDCLVLTVDAALPAAPRYPINSQQRITKSRVVDLGRSYEIVRPSTLDDAAEKNLRRGHGILWAYGYLDYIDFLRQRRRVGFCFAFEPIVDPMYPSAVSGGGRWVNAGPATYTFEVDAVNL